MNKILSILQICDSAFPIGTFNHSYGMETYLREKVIKDSCSFEKWMIMYIETQILYTDGLAIKLVYNYIDEKKIEKIWELDRIITVQNIAFESREGNKLIASREMEIVESLYNVALLKEYKERIKNKECFGNPAIIYGILMNYLKIDRSLAIITYGYSQTSTLVQSAVRAIPLGQKDGQIILKNMFKILEKVENKIRNMNLDDFGYSFPGFEISQMNHEILNFRLFMS